MISKINGGPSISSLERLFICLKLHTLFVFASMLILPIKTTRSLPFTVQTKKIQENEGKEVEGKNI